MEEEPQDNHEEHPTSSDPRDPTQRQSTWHWADRRDPGTTQPTWADAQDPTQSTWADTPDPTQSTWADTPDSSQSTYTQDPTHSTWAGTNHSQPTWADPQDPTQSTWADTQNLSQSNWADAQDPTQSTFPSTQDSSQSTWVDPQRPTQPGRTHKILASQPGPPVNLPNTGRLQLTEAGKIRRMIKTTLSHNQGRAQKLTLRSGLAQAESQAKETSKMFCKVVGLSSARSVGNTLGEVVGSSAVTN